MADIEKVIEGLNYCKEREGSCISCPGSMECWCDEAIELLKKQDERIKELELEKGLDESPDMMGKW